MPAIRHVRISRFRGFDAFETRLPAHAVLVGEAGAGRSNLIEGIWRVLDQDAWRSHRADELDFFDLGGSVPAEVELVIGDLGAGALAALALRLEYWDRTADQFVASLADPADYDPDRHESVIRIAYRLSTGVDGRLDEVVHWPKHAGPAGEVMLVRAAERLFLPFVSARGVGPRPLDLAGRGDLRALIDAQPGEPLEAAIERFLDEVRRAAADFSSQDRVLTALGAILTPLRGLRRFDTGAPPSDVVRFLPDGGAATGLMRSLSAALTLADGPAEFPAVRHGASALVALRAGLMIAAAANTPGAIVAVDDLSADVDHALAGHLAATLRASSGQAIVAARSGAVIDMFEPEEIVRLSWAAGARTVHLGRRPVSKADRLAQRYHAWQIAPALSASTVVVVEGLHDRLSVDGVARRTARDGNAPSLAAAGIEVIEADGAGEIAKVAEQASQLGLWTIALFDNDDGPGAPPSPPIIAATASADVVLVLPPRTAIEEVITADLTDDELRGAMAEVAIAVPDIRLPTGWEIRTGADLRKLVIEVLHGQKGAIHALFIRALPRVGTTATALIARLHVLATVRAETGQVTL